MAAPDFPITKERIQHHFHYAWWQYFALVIVAVFGVNLVFTMTHYRSPEHLKVEWYYQGISSPNTVGLGQQLLEEIWQTEFPEMEEVNFNLAGTDETYGAMQLMAWIAAGQGDLYILQKDTYQGYAGEDSMVNLQPYVDDGTLNVEGIDLRSAVYTNPETGVTGLYGIPCDALQKMWDYDMKPEGAVMCLPLGSGNIEKALVLLDYLLDNWK